MISLVTGSLGSKRYSACISVVILVPPWFDNKMAGKRSQWGISHKGQDSGSWPDWALWYDNDVLSAFGEDIADSPLKS